MLKARNVNILFALLFFCLVYLRWTVGASYWYFALLILVYSVVLCYGVMFVSASFFVPIKCKGDSTSQAVAITFDDGPVPKLTDQILDILSARNIKATFFCIGQRVEQHPEILSRVHLSGHAIGNHTFLHGKFFDMLPALKMSNELEMTDKAIEAVIKRKPRFFRPPYGVTNPNLAKAIRKGNYVTMGWSVRSLDTMAKDEDKLYHRVTENLKAGDVILFHDYSEITIRVLPRILDHIEKRGLRILRLDELVNEAPYV